ncbi:dihydrouridine synthase [Morchella snyderi]|nr:dihydrouridine synthase [Morchella snyderi]
MSTINELPIRRDSYHPLRLFEAAKAANRPLFIQAPMVRYSKLPFRALIREYGVELCYTPMILAKEFVRNQSARLSDFSTSSEDGPLVVQFGAHTVLDFAKAAELVQPYCDGVDLNCGCPQTWAIQEGIGCGLMRKPELVRDMIMAAKERCGSQFCVSVKIRIHSNLQETVRFVTIVETGGPDYITVHGRRRSQKSTEPVNLEAIRLIKSVSKVPVVANGDVFCLDDVDRIIKATRVDGVMAARGLLENPALFAGYSTTPWGAVEKFLHLNMTLGPLPHQLTVHHVGEMMLRMLNKKERSSMVDNSSNTIELLDWLDERFVLARSCDNGFGKAVHAVRIV